MTRSVTRTCPLCEATCGLALELDGDDIVSVRGDRDDVLSHGYLCPKGAAYGQLQADPDRLSAPLVRQGSGFEEVGWDEAFGLVAERLVPLLESDRDAVATYLGNPNVHNLAGAFYVKPLVKALGTRNVFTASTVDQMPKHVACGYVFGDPAAIPVPDIDRTDHLLILGANPRMSNGSLWTAPDLPGRLDALRARGGRLVVVDPRRSRTAASADEHVPIRPGTDALLLAAIVHALADAGSVEPGPLGEHLAGLDTVLEAVARFTPERVADACGVPARTIRRLADELAAAPTAAVYGRIGTHTARFGTLAAWLVDVLNAATGNLDRPGGAMFPLAAHTLPKPPREFRTGRWHSRVRGWPEVLGELPVATLADEILVDGPGQVRGLVVVAGNPARSTPNTARLERALRQLDLLVCVDPYLNETSCHADVILPPEPDLARLHYDVAFSGFAVRNVANISPPATALPPGRVPEWQTLLRLAGIAMGLGARTSIGELDQVVAAEVAQRIATSPGAGGHGCEPEELLTAVAPRTGPARVLDLLLRAGPYGDGFGADPEGLSLRRLEEHPHGLDLGALRPRVPAVLRTLSGRVELAPPPLVADLDRLEASLATPERGPVLVGRRHLRTNNSWMHNLPMLTRGRDLCTLQVHPDDATRWGLTDGADAEVISHVGRITAPVEITEDILPGVVSLPHGFGHDAEGSRLRVAARSPGVDSNRLTDHAEIDPLSGNAVLNAVPVRVGPPGKGGP